MIGVKAPTIKARKLAEPHYSKEGLYVRTLVTTYYTIYDGGEISFGTSSTIQKIDEPDSDYSKRCAKVKQKYERWIFEFLKNPERAKTKKQRRVLSNSSNPEP